MYYYSSLSTVHHLSDMIRIIILNVDLNKIIDKFYDKMLK